MWSNHCSLRKAELPNIAMQEVKTGDAIVAKTKSTNDRYRRALRNNGFPFDPDVKKNWYSAIVQAIENKGDGKSLQESHLTKEVLRIVGYRSRSQVRLYLQGCILRAAKRLAGTNVVERYRTGTHYRYRINPDDLHGTQALKKEPIIPWTRETNDRSGRGLKAQMPDMPMELEPEDGLPNSLWAALPEDGEEEAPEDDDRGGSSLDDHAGLALARFLGGEVADEHEDDAIELENREPLLPEFELSDLGTKLESFTWEEQEGLNWRGVHNPTKRIVALRIDSKGHLRATIDLSAEEAQLLLRVNATLWPGFIIAHQLSGAHACHIHLPPDTRALWDTLIEQELATIDEVLDGA